MHAIIIFLVASFIINVLVIAIDAAEDPEYDIDYEGYARGKESEE